MAPMWVTVSTPMTPPTRMGAERRGFPSGRKEALLFDPAAVRSIRATKPSTKIMLAPPAFLAAGGHGDMGVPTMDADAYYNEGLPTPGQGNAAAKRRAHAGVGAYHHHGGDSVASALTPRSLDSGAGGRSEAEKASLREAKAGETAAAGKRQALAFAMRGLEGSSSGAQDMRTESWKKVKPRKPGAEPTVIERMLERKERRAIASSLAEDELKRRREARARVVADGGADPGSPLPPAAYGQASRKVSAMAAPLAAAAGGEEQKGGDMRDNLLAFISRPGSFVTTSDKPPRPQPKQGPRQAAVGSTSVGGRVTLPTGRPSYELTTSSAFYDRARAVATERRGPDPEEAAREAAEAAAKEKAEGKKRQIASAVKGANAFLWRGFMSPEEIQRQLNEEAAKAKALRDKDPDYLRRKKKDMEKSLGPGYTPLFRSATKLVFDKKEKAVLTQFLYSGAKGIGLAQTGRATKGKAFNALVAAEAAHHAAAVGHAVTLDLTKPLGLTLSADGGGVVCSVKPGGQGEALGFVAGCVVAAASLEDLTYGLARAKEQAMHDGSDVSVDGYMAASLHVTLKFKDPAALAAAKAELARARRAVNLGCVAGGSGVFDEDGEEGAEEGSDEESGGNKGSGSDEGGGGGGGHAGEPSSPKEARAATAKKAGGDTDRSAASVSGTSASGATHASGDAVYSRWGNTSHGSTAAVLKDLARLNFVATRVNSDLGKATAAAAADKARLEADAAAAAKVAARQAMLRELGVTSDDTAGKGKGEDEDDEVDYYGEAEPEGKPPPPTETAAAGSGGHERRRPFTESMAFERGGGGEEGGGEEKEEEEEEEEEGDEGAALVLAVPLDERTQQQKDDAAHAEGWARGRAEAKAREAAVAASDTMAYFDGTRWDPSVAVCARSGCQGCKYHGLKSRSKKDWPGPSSYCLPSGSSLVPGGAFNTSKAKTELEWVIYKESKLPGPADHPDRSFERSTGGGKFNKSKAKTNLEWVMYHAAQMPSSAEYSGVAKAYASTVQNTGMGAKFSTGNPKTDVEWRIYAQSKTPGPGAHGDVGPSAMGRAQHDRVGSSTAGTTGFVRDHHPFALPAKPQPIPLLRNWQGSPPASPRHRSGNLLATAGGASLEHPHGSYGGGSLAQSHSQSQSHGRGGGVGFASTSSGGYSSY